MSQLLLYDAAPWAHPLTVFTEIIDVRSPGEYGEDHLPGAINLPVLNDGERAEVGILYKRVSPFGAKKRGAALIARNIGGHMDRHFANLPKGYHPLIYCWRGGMRSQSLALVLTQIGWRVTLLTGGYQTYRAQVRQLLNDGPFPWRFRVLTGLTGSGKTKILRALGAAGEQILDLEAIANHRGSLLGQTWRGEMPQSQPSQKQFESRLWAVLRHCDPQRVIWVESESNRVGQRQIPDGLWQSLRRSPLVEIQVPLAVRIQGLLEEYLMFISAPHRLKALLTPLTTRYGHQVLAQWHEWIDRGQWETLVLALLEHHYDPLYRRSLNHLYGQSPRPFPLPDLTTATVAAAIAPLREIDHGI